MVLFFQDRIDQAQFFVVNTSGKDALLRLYLLQNMERSDNGFTQYLYFYRVNEERYTGQ